MLPLIAVKSKTTAALLAFFLGWAGIHRFYLGFVTWGIAQLVLSVLLAPCTVGATFVAGVAWGIVEGLLIQNGTISRDADGRPLGE